MTTPNVDTRTAGRELDAEVAERLMGYVWKRSAWTTGSPARHCRVLIKPDVAALYGDSELRGDEIDVLAVERVPRYSTDIAAAWLVVEHLNRLFDGLRGFTLSNYRRLDDGGPVTVWIAGWENAPPMMAESPRAAPLAICLAALASRPPDAPRAGRAQGGGVAEGHGRTE